MGAADAFSDVLSTIPAGSSAAWKDVLPAGHGGAASAWHGVLPAGHGVGAHAPSIKEMQESLMELGKAMSQYAAFNAFLQSRYTSDESLDFRAMEAVGNAGKADGAWGKRTDAGLQEALKLAVALNKMHDAMHLAREGYDPAALKGLIPDGFDKGNAEIADKLNAEIGKLIAYYSNIARYMEQRYRDKLQEGAAVVKYNAGGLSKVEEAYAATHANEGVLKLMDGTVVRLKDLESPQALQAFFTRSYPNAAEGKMDPKTQAQWMLDQLGGG